MKKIYIILIIVIIVTAGIFILIGNDEVDPDPNEQLDQQEEMEEREELEEMEVQGDSDSRLDMQGYYLDIPENYDCVGGLTQGYKYLDAECEPDEGDYRIVSERGLAVTTVAGDSFASMYSSLLSHDINGFCEPFAGSEDIDLDAEHYICEHIDEGKNMLTIGIGKLFNNNQYAQHFEVHLQRDLDSDIEDDDIDKLISFLNTAIDIDWSIYEE